MTQLNICEIFGSVQGEGVQSGVPMVFIRFKDCNLRCIWCDTQYAYGEGKDMSAEYIIEQVRKLPYKWVCLTGGEPFIQDTEELVLKLVENHYKIAVETNGTVMPSHIVYHLINTMTVSPKLSNSGMFSELKPLVVSTLCFHPHAQLKFVVENREDMMEALEFCSVLWREFGCTPIKHIPIVFQPLAHPEASRDKLIEMLQMLWNLASECQQKQNWDVRVMPQTHRLLFGAMRGV